jgi:hypothetical protein
MGVLRQLKYWSAQSLLREPTIQVHSTVARSTQRGRRV